jgi:hypothetical protein
VTTPQDPGDREQPEQFPPAPPPPAAPPVSESEYRQVERPKAVDTAFTLWFVAAGVGLLSNILGLATAQDVANEVSRRIGTTVDSSQTATGVGTTITSIVLLALWVAIVFQMRKGANWARILLTVLGVLSVLAGLFGLLLIGVLFSIGILGVLQALLGIAQLVTVIAAIVFMYKRESNAYFKAH